MTSASTERWRFGGERRRNPLVVAAVGYLWLGLAFASYNGLQWTGIVPAVDWISWSHTHFLTVGAFTQLVLGSLPVLSARRLDRPVPPGRVHWLNFAGLNGGFLLLWYGRAFGSVLAFDVGLYVLWLLAFGLFLLLLKQVMRSDGRAWNATTALYLLSVFVFLWGITYAYGLYGHLWRVPGGWEGLREAHVHANTWGFLALAAVGTLYALFPHLVDADLYSERLKDVSVPFFAAGIFPLITGPWLDVRAVIVTGLVLYATGFTLYFYVLVRTYKAGRGSGPALWLLVAQVWILGPAFAAPLLLFEFELVPWLYLEQGLIHFYFMGWALPVALAGVVFVAGTGDGPGGSAGGRPAHRPGASGTAVARAIPKWAVAAWTVALVANGAGFFFQDQAWGTYLFGGGTVALALLWAFVLVQATALFLGRPAPDVGGVRS